MVDIMYITKTECRVIDSLSIGKKRFDVLSEELSIKKPNLSNYLKKLEEKGIIRTSRIGRGKMIALESWISRDIDSLRSSIPQLKLSDLIAGRKVFLVAYSKGKEFAIRDTDLPKATAKRAVSGLRSSGIFFMKKKGIYVLRKESEKAGDFCRRFIEATILAEARNAFGKIDQHSVSFDSAKGAECVFATKTATKHKGYWPTAYSVASNYGLSLVSAGKYYYANIEPKAADVVMHMLALDKGTRSIIYAAAIASKAGITRNLLTKRQRFGMDEEFIQGFVNLVEGKAEFEGIKYDEVRGLI